MGRCNCNGVGEVGTCDGKFGVLTSLHYARSRKAEQGSSVESGSEVGTGALFDGTAAHFASRMSDILHRHLNWFDAISCKDSCNAIAAFPSGITTRRNYVYATREHVGSFCISLERASLFRSAIKSPYEDFYLHDATNVFPRGLNALPVGAEQ